MLRRARRRLKTAINQLNNPPHGSVDTAAQILLSLRYSELARQGQLPSFEDVHFRNYSQNGEDGILLFIFSVIGAATKTVVELGIGTPTQSNSTNLLVNHGWRGLLVDADEASVRAAREFFEQHPDTAYWPPRVEHARLTAEIVNSLIESNLDGSDVDLLSIDIDGMDYWIWKSITAIQPRVVLIEYQDMFGDERSITAPYDPDFKPVWEDGYMNFGGASLPALVKLGREKNYRLIGCERRCFNAFFMRWDVGVEAFPEVPVSACLQHPAVARNKKTRLKSAMKFDWQEV